MDNKISPQFIFNFLDSSLSTAAETAQRMEQLIFSDPASAIVKARMFAEEILKEIFKIENINSEYISSFYEKLIFLSEDGILTTELQRAFDIIRRSGNKAAHDATYGDITIALQLHKEMFKIAVWFYETYTSEQKVIPTYNQPKPVISPGIDDIKNMVKSMLEESSVTLEALSKKDSTKTNHLDGELRKQENKEPVISHVVPAKEALEEPLLPNARITVDESDTKNFLLKEVSRLKDSAKEAIENANEFSRFKEYMHVDRKIQLDLEKVLQNQSQKTEASLILLCGSVGDGKSHLLAYMNKKYPEIMKDYFIHNDATESFSPGKDAMETLEELLNPFTDEKIDSASQKIILAINLGVLHNFVNHDHKHGTFSKLKEFVESSRLFSQNIVTNFEVDQFNLFNFTDYHPYELTSEGPVSEFYQSLLNKVFSEEENNPFYIAYKKDHHIKCRTMLHENYDFLENKFVQKQIISLVIQSIVKKKLVISTRAFLNFIADILICENLKPLNELNNFEILKNAVPSLLFNNIDRSPILKNITYFDPIHSRTSETDQLIIELNTLNEWSKINDEYVKDGTSRKWLEYFEMNNELLPELFSEYFEGFIRIVFLTNPNFAKSLQDEAYDSYMLSLYHFNTGDMKKVRTFYENFKDSIYQWKGTIKKDYVLMSHPFDKYKLGQSFTVKPVVTQIDKLDDPILYTFKSVITVGYKKEGSLEEALLDIDYPLYSLLVKVAAGYRPNKGDEDDAIKFTEFLERVMKFGNKHKELLINFPRENKFYKIKRDDFGSLVFERE